MTKKIRGVHIGLAKWLAHSPLHGNKPDTGDAEIEANEYFSSEENGSLLKWLHRCYKENVCEGIDLQPILEQILLDQSSLRINEAGLLLEIVLCVLWERLLMFMNVSPPIKYFYTAFVFDIERPSQGSKERYELPTAMNNGVRMSKLVAAVKLKRIPRALRCSPNETSPTLPPSDEIMDNKKSALYIEDFLHVQSLKLIEVPILHEIDGMNETEEELPPSIRSSVILEHSTSSDDDSVYIEEETDDDAKINQSICTVDNVNQSETLSPNQIPGYELRKRRSVAWLLQEDTAQSQRQDFVSLLSESVPLPRVPSIELCDKVISCEHTETITMFMDLVGEQVLCGPPIQRMWLPPTGVMTNMGVNGSMRLFLERLQRLNWVEVTIGSGNVSPLNEFEESPLHSRDVSSLSDGMPIHSAPGIVHAVKKRLIDNTANNNGGNNNTPDSNQGQRKNHNLVAVKNPIPLQEFIRKSVGTIPLEGVVKFSELVSGKSKEEAAKTFVSILASKNQGLTLIHQDRPFSDIHIKFAKTPQATHIFEHKQFRTFLTAVHPSHAVSLLEWLKGSDHPKNLKKSLALTPIVNDLLAHSSLGGRHFVVILPEDQAWKPKENQPDLYVKIKNSPSLAQQLLFDAVAEVGKKINSLKDLKDEYLETLSGTPLVLDGEKLYYAKNTADGSLKKINKPLPIKPKPVAVLDDATIFASTQIRLPDDTRHGDL